MNPAHRDGWPPAPGLGNPHQNNEQQQTQPHRPGASFGPGTPSHQPQPSPHGSAGGPPQAGPFVPFQQAGHSLPNITGLGQSSPRHPPQGQSGQQPTHGFPMHDSRERDAREVHIKEEQDAAFRRDQQRERDARERQHLEQVPPHQTPAGPIHLHQPVAIGPRTAHGPNGLLGNPAAIAGPNGHPQLGAPVGPAGIFAGGPVQPPAQSAQQAQVGLMVPFGAGAPVAGVGQGQQPILNDALSYLDQVKVQFVEHPDVYNRFLDIMKDFKSGAIDTPGVIDRVSSLFAGNPELIQGFNTFLPPGYRIECGTGDDPNAIRVTTPMGTTVQSMPQPQRPLSNPRSAATAQDNAGGDGAVFNAGPRAVNGTWTPQPGHPQQMLLSPSGRPVGPAPFGGQMQPQQGMASLEAQREQQALVHQQEQRGVSQLTNAVSAATGTLPRQALMSPPGGSSTPLPGQEMGGVGPDGQALGAGMEKQRGPVEFNHAISYVNKIKNRFSSQPDIYKQFLEILQTYQRESKPIQDVYGQVTRLFHTAPDLLEDFKQFLPESAAHAKAAAAARQQAEDAVMLSNVRGEPFYTPGQGPQPHQTPRAEHRLPPVGNFAPTPTVNKDNKRKRGDRQGTVASNVGGMLPESSASAAKVTNGFGQVSATAKRAKQTHGARQPDAPGAAPVSPSLVPALPEPLPPTTSSIATSEELSFFDRAKKVIGNKNTMNEFLKLCNLFSQDLIDRTMLVHRAQSFIGGNPDLFKWFKDWVGYEEKDVLVENRAKVPSGRISLSNCRGLGPSYRLLPKRGAGSPHLHLEAPLETEDKQRRAPRTSASASSRKRKSSGTAISSAKRKKWGRCDQFDLDHLNFLCDCPKNFRDVAVEIGRPKRKGEEYFEANMEKLQERMKPCSGRDELCNSVLNDHWASHPTWASEDSGFIAHRKNIHEEGLHKIEEERHDYDYNIEACGRTIQLLEPIAQQLRRMSEHEAQTMELPPNLGGQSETIHKRVIMKLYGREKGAQVIAQLYTRPYAVVPVLLNRLLQKLQEWKTAQREWEKVWRDQTQKMFWKSLDHQAVNAKQNDKKQFQTKTLVNEIQTRYEEQKRQRLAGVGIITNPQLKYNLEDIGVIMDACHLVLLWAEHWHANDFPKLITFIREFVPMFFGLDPEWFHTQIRNKFGDSPVNEAAEDSASAMDDPVISKPRKINGKGLLRGVLDRGRKLGRGDGSQTPLSRASTPDNASHIDDDMSEGINNTDDAKSETPLETWAEHPVGGNVLKNKDVILNEPFKRDAYNLYGNQNIYCFVRMFIILYERLHKLKEAEPEVRETVKRAMAPKPAIELGIVDKLPPDFFVDPMKPETNFYRQVLTMFEDFVKQEMEISHIEDCLRRYYLQSGWQMYSADKLLGALVRFAIAIISSDSKDKSWEILQLFKKDRVKEETTYQDELIYRKQVEKYNKEGDVYKITYNQATAEATIKVFRKDEPTFDTSRMLDEDAWRVYVNDFTGVTPTTGAPQDQVKQSILKRNVRAATAGDNIEAYGRRYDLVNAKEALEFRISVHEYKLQFIRGNDEFWYQPESARDMGKEGAEEALRAAERRNDAVRERFVMNNDAMKGLSKEDVEKANQNVAERAKNGWDQKAGSAAQEGQKNDEMEE